MAHRMATRTVAEVVAAKLHAAGVRRVFGLPGGETVELLDALRRVGIDFVLVANESSALFMADAQIRLEGGVGVCLTTLGPGATNAVMGCAHAYLDRAPILLITAQKPAALLPDYTHQVLDLHALFCPITKATWRIHPANTDAVLSAALDLAVTGRPGPVHLQLSNEDAGQPYPPGDDSTPTDIPTPPPFDPTIVDQARALLRQARRPLILAGLGLEPQRPYTELRALAESLAAPVVVTPKAKGALPDGHALAGGVIGLTHTDPAYALVDEADCIVAVGFDVVELVKPWATPAPLIWLAPWTNHDPVLPAVVELVGDTAAYLRALARDDYDSDPAWGATRVARYRADLAKPLPSPAPGRLLPQQVLSTLRAGLPRHAIMVVDVGSHKIHSSLEWPTLVPNSFLLSNGLSGMGYALPAALGASLAAPDTPVVCLTGDAGMAMVMGELAVLAAQGGPILVTVLNDGAIDLIRAQQVRAGKPVYGTEFVPPDFTQIAAAYGLPAVRVTTQDALCRAIADFMAAPTPRVIEVMLDPISYPTTPQPSTHSSRTT